MALRRWGLRSGGLARNSFLKKHEYINRYRSQATWQLREALEIKLRDETWYVEEALARRLQVMRCVFVDPFVPCQGWALQCLARRLQVMGCVVVDA